MAVRSDHLGGLGTEPRLSRLAEQGLHLVAPLAGDALREAIEQPAALAGLRLEHGLVELLVRDCEGEPGGLPLLSHALAETWRRRDGNVADRRGLSGHRRDPRCRRPLGRPALRQPARGPASGRCARCCCGWSPRPSTATRSAAGCRAGACSATPTGSASSALLVRARLVTSEEDTFELAHEALARAWPRLQSWLDDDVAGQRILRHLVTAADGWESLGRPTASSTAAPGWTPPWSGRKPAHPHLTELEQQFLAASVDQATAETRAIAERARRDARQNRRLRSLLGATAVLLVAALIVGYVAIRQREEANSERHVATARELAAAANANVTIDAERSVLLALAAVEESRSGDGSCAASRPKRRSTARSRPIGSSSACPASWGARTGARMAPLRHRGSPELRYRRHPRRPQRRLGAVLPRPRRRRDRRRVQPRRDPAGHHRRRRCRPGLEPGHRGRTALHQRPELVRM